MTVNWWRLFIFHVEHDTGVFSCRPTWVVEFLEVLNHFLSRRYYMYFWFTIVFPFTILLWLFSPWRKSQSCGTQAQFFTQIYDLEEHNFSQNSQFLQYQTRWLAKNILWWCYRASVCAIGITSLSLSDSCNMSFILSHCNHQITNHQPTDTLSRNLHNRNGPTFHGDSTGRRSCTWLCRPLHTRSIWHTSHTGG